MKTSLIALALALPLAGCSVASFAEPLASGDDTTDDSGAPSNDAGDSGGLSRLVPDGDAGSTRSDGGSDAVGETEDDAASDAPVERDVASEHDVATDATDATEATLDAGDDAPPVCLSGGTHCECSDPSGTTCVSGGGIIAPNHCCSGQCHVTSVGFVCLGG